ncbi:MAG: BamA/TamA family outer membrane protein [Gemmatimonadota bacterium]
MKGATMLACLACLACLAQSRAAQAQAVLGELPDTAAERIVALYNRDGVTRLGGDAHLSPGSEIRGGVAVLDGTLTVEGRISGDVIVINGDLIVRGPGGAIDGSVTVTGGQISIVDGGVINGATLVYREPLRYRDEGGRIVHVLPERADELSAGVDLPFGRTDILLSEHGAYNRVEGLPVAVGPRIRLGGSYPVTARAVLIVRTATASDAASELDIHRFGYDVRAEQLVAPAAGLSLGVRLYSEVAAVEQWGLSDRESALATFLLHHDQRDHYEREGWALYATSALPGSPYSLELTYRDEEHLATAVADPFTLFYRRDAWRPEPSVAQGALRSALLRAIYDTRNEKRDPSTGWLIDAELEQGLGGSLDNPGAIDPLLGTVETRSARVGFGALQVDMRRYARLSPYARLGLRVFAAGSLDGRPLPPQRQHALGGEGSLPGYGSFEFDCGARVNTVIVRGDTYHPYYGCDRVGLIQLEYQAGFPFMQRVTQSLGLGSSVGRLVRWVAFFDAGRAWTEPAARDGRLGGRDDFSVDTGAGLRIGPLGVYWAMPLSGSGRSPNFFVRLGPRI